MKIKQWNPRQKLFNWSYFRFYFAIFQLHAGLYQLHRIFHILLNTTILNRANTLCSSSSWNSYFHWNVIVISFNYIIFIFWPNTFVYIFPFKITIIQFVLFGGCSLKVLLPCIWISGYVYSISPIFCDDIVDLLYARNAVLSWETINPFQYLQNWGKHNPITGILHCPNDTVLYTWDYEQTKKYTNMVVIWSYFETKKEIQPKE